MCPVGLHGQCTHRLTHMPRGVAYGQCTHRLTYMHTMHTHIHTYTNFHTCTHARHAQIHTCTRAHTHAHTRTRGGCWLKAWQCSKCFAMSVDMMAPTMDFRSRRCSPMSVCSCARTHASGYVRQKAAGWGDVGGVGGKGLRTGAGWQLWQSLFQWERGARMRSACVRVSACAQQRSGQRFGGSV